MSEKKSIEELLGICRADEAETGDYLKAFFYSEPGGGKTYLSASADEVPEMSPVLIIDYDKKAPQSIKQFFPNVYIVDGIALPSDKGVRVNVESRFEEILKFLKADTKFNTVVVDPVSEFMNLILLEETSKPTKQDPVRNIFSHPSRDDYQRCFNRINHYLRELIALPKHIIVTAHTMPLYEGEGDDERFVGYMPNIPGKAMPDRICGKFMIVGCLRVEPPKAKGQQERRVLNARYHPMYRKLRSNFPALQEIENPTMAKIVDIIKNGGVVQNNIKPKIVSKC